MLSTESQAQNITFFSTIWPSLQEILEKTDVIPSEGKQVSGCLERHFRELNWEGS